MRAQLIKSSPGAGKTTAVAAAVRQGSVGARVVTGSLRLARELAVDHDYALVEGRNPANCQRYDVVHALGEAGHRVDRLACGRSDKPSCPFRNDCVYWRQFEQVGPRVGAAEQLFNRNFLAGGRLAVVDDADLMRTLVERVFLSKEALGRAFKLLKGKRRTTIRQLLTVLGHAALEAPCRADGTPSIVMGSAAWDQIARTSKLYGYNIHDLIEALPRRVSLPKPRPNEQGVVDEEAILDVPPATLAGLMAVLRDELPLFMAGEDFNSRLRLSVAGIEVWYLKDHARSRTGQPLLPDMDLLILDATPVPTLVDYLTRDHKRLPDVEVRVRMPENAKVVQYATTTNGHTVLRNVDKVKQVQSEIAAERLTMPRHPEMEGAICFRSMRPALLADGFVDAQVVSFGSVRGTNALADVERLHLVGRPMPPGEDLVFMAQVLHPNEPAISQRMVLSPRVFGGQSYEVDVVDYADARVAELLRAQREDEMEQAIHRARIFTLEQPGLGLSDTRPSREQLRVVLHTSHPVPGLRVDELITRTESAQLNDVRHEDSERRIRGAILRLQEMCEPVTAVAVAKLASASRRTVGSYLRTHDHTPKRESSYKGVITLPQNTSASSSPTAFPNVRPEEGCLCRGGCGKAMPPGQACFECASRQVEAWRRTKSKEKL